jgi:hypothetical protein
MSPVKTVAPVNDELEARLAAVREEHEALLNPDREAERRRARAAELEAERQRLELELEHRQARAEFEEHVAEFNAQKACWLEVRAQVEQGLDQLLELLAGPGQQAQRELDRRGHAMAQLRDKYPALGMVALSHVHWDSVALIKDLTHSQEFRRRTGQPLCT